MPIYDVEIIFCGTSSQDFSQWWKTENTRVYIPEEELPGEVDPYMLDLLYQKAKTKLNWTDGDWNFTGLFRWGESHMTPDEKDYYEPVEYWDPLV